MATALADYRLAVQCEERRELDRALVLYRRAFQVDPHVDRAYYLDEERRLQEAAAAAAQEQLAAAAHSASAEFKPDGLLKKFDKLVLKNTQLTGPLASVVSQFPEHLTFDPEIEEEGVPLSKIPDELLILVLRKLDHGSIERFAAVCKKARVISLDSVLWRYVVIWVVILAS
jgi:F-box protein 9